MISKNFIHVGMGDTGEGIVRNAVHVNLIKRKRLKLLDSGAHIPLSRALEISPNAQPFTFIRNPFDWYLSYYKHELMLQRYMGRFCHWFNGIGRETGPAVMADIWHYYIDPGIDMEYIGKFENFKSDFIRIFSKVCPIVDEAAVESWFPNCFAAWMGRPWLEGIEQWYREDCYTDAMVQQVYRQDAEIFDTWGYSFEEHYDFRVMSE